MDYISCEINSHRLFCIKLIHELVQPLLSLKASPEGNISYSKGRRLAASKKRPLGKHFPHKVSQRGRCIVCSNKKTLMSGCKDTKTTSHCPRCDVYLCIGTCFDSTSHVVVYWPSVKNARQCLYLCILY